MEIFTSHAFYLMMSILILVLYNTDAAVAPCLNVLIDQHTETVDTRHEGCYDIVNEEPFIRLTDKDSNIDIEACIEMCYTDGFAFTGRKWGVCYCWSVIGFTKKEDNLCISRCQNRGECLPCGSPIGKAPQPPVLTSIYRTEPQDSRFIGCYDARQGTTDQVYALPWWPFESRSDLTVDICIDACKTKLFKYAGLAVKYCFCGNSEYDYFGKSSLGCYSKCSGINSQVCGGQSAGYAQNISVYQTGKTPDDDRYLGCFSSIDGQIQDENEDNNVNIMTIDICISRCHKMNKHAALKAGSECYCSNFTASQPSHDGSCDTPCPGNTSQTCGDNSNYAVYKSVCRPGTFGSGCDGQCHCLNQAVCNVKDGKCPNDECAPKWSGENCQVCAELFFGPKCEGQCHCLNQEVCNGANGMCPGKCAEGWTGSNCQENCAAGFFGPNCEGKCHCLNQEACDSTNGICPDGKCAPQWTGSDCQECAAGFFGPTCEGQCHCLNQVVCDSTNGMCPDGKCAPQWTGTDCQECAAGFFGPICEGQCHCLNQVVCDSTNGICPDGKCAPQWTGSDCQECVAGFFGPKCEGECHCLNQEACDSTNGNCPGNCAEGWTDSNCQQKCSDSTFGPDCIHVCRCKEGAPCDRISGECNNGECEAGWMASNCSVAEFQNSNGVDPGIIGGALGIIVALIVILVVVFIFLRKRKAKPKDRAIIENGSNEHVGVRNEVAEQLEDEIDKSKVKAEAEVISKDADVNSSQQPATDVYENFQPIKKPIKLADLNAYVEKENKMDEPFKTEFGSIPHGLTAKCDAGKDEEIIKVKNRFKNIIAFDHSRVKLQEIPGVPHSDYVNANFIKNYKKETVYIAAQGPTPKTLDDFWRMIWEQNVQNIVMLTNLSENDRTKCEKYWPDVNEEMEYEDLTITSDRDEEWPDYNIRYLNVKKAGEGDARHLKQFHFTSWPDHGVPQYATPLLNLLRKVKCNLSDAGPTIIHCSAGVGRTGTFIALDYLLDQAKTEGVVDVYSCVSLLRSDRVNMVQTVDQYMFIYTAMLEAVTVGDTTIPCFKFNEIYEQLQEQSPYTVNTRLQEQFKMLEFLKPVYPEVAYYIAKKEKNVANNRSMDILPANIHFVKNVGANGKPGYINAVFVKGYRDSGSYIVTQLPLVSTKATFWQMVLNYECPIIVSLHHIDDMSESRYWPDLDQELTLKTLTLSCLEDSNDGDISIHNINIKQEDVSHDVTLYHYDLDFETPNIEDLGKTIHFLSRLYELVKKRQQNTSNNPVVVQCLYGSERCGIFCAASCLLDMMNEEQEVDVFRIVQHIRATRPQFIADTKQYNYLYKVAMSHLDTFDQYSNFK